MAVRFTAALLATCGLLLGGSLLADEKGGDKSPGKVEKKGDEKGKAKRTWAVVQIGDELKVVQEDKIAEIKKDLEKESKDKGHKKGKKPEPKKTLKVLKGNIASQVEAEKAKEEIIAKEKDHKKGDKGDKKPTGHKKE